MPRPRVGRQINAIILAGAALLLLAADDSTKKAASPQPNSATARLIQVPLPITGDADTSIKRTINQILESTATDGESRPIMILEFQSNGDESSDASEFERSLSIARFLASDRLSGVRTVAYLPDSVRGHAVLPVLACEEIIIAPDAELGHAGIAETHIDESMRSSYREMARRRRTIPAAVALGMLDKAVAVSQIKTLDGLQYVFSAELQELQEKGGVSSVNMLTAAGDSLSFTGSELRLEFGFASHLASDRSGLLAALELPSGALEQDPSLGGEWRAIRVDVRGPINATNINWLLQSMKKQLSQSPDGVNFVCLTIDSPGGSLVDSLRLAGYFASLDPTQVRTVAFIESEARADAAIIAWSCNQLVMKHDAVLGGPGAINVDSREAPELRKAVQSIARDTQRDWSLPLALVDPKIEVGRYTNNRGDVRYFSADELGEQADPQQWKRDDAMDVSQGLSGREANAIGLARHTASSLAELRQLYQIDAPLESVKPNWAHFVIEQLSSPRVAGLMLTIAWFALIFEGSQPGVGVGGFIAVLCFLLFFWSSFLNGTAAWLEGVLFAAGVASLAVEFFVIPGFGIFGFGGACMVIASLVLASQTFIVPRNSYQIEQFTNSLVLVAAGLVGTFASLLAVRKYLPNAPLFRRLILDKPDKEDLEERESLADYRHLLGKRGTTTTQLTPSGKARFGDEQVDVISDGEVVSRGIAVLVSEVHGTHVLVEMIDDRRRN